MSGCKKIIMLLAVVLLLPFQVSAEKPDWRVSEVMSNALDEQGDEFVEFYYSGEEKVDLSGWSLGDSSKKGVLFDYVGEYDLGKQGLNVENGDILVVVDSDYAGYYNDILPDEVDLSVVVMVTTENGSIGNGLKNTEDRVELISNEDVIVADYEWNQDAGNGFSWENIGGDWSVSDSDRGHSLGVSRWHEEKKDIEEEVIDEDDAKKEIVEEEEYVYLSNLNEFNNYANKTKVRLDGMIGVEYGVLEDDYFWLQDDTGGVACKYDGDFEHKTGDLLMVEGSVKELTYHQVLQVDKIEFRGNGRMNYPLVKGGDLTEYEDMVVRIGGIVSEIDGDSWYINDNNNDVRVYIKDRVNIGDAKPGEGEMVEIVGLVNEINSGWRVLPRGVDDIILDREANVMILPSVGFSYKELWRKIINYFVPEPIALGRLWLWGNYVAGG